MVGRRGWAAGAGRPGWAAGAGRPGLGGRGHGGAAQRAHADVSQARTDLTERALVVVQAFRSSYGQA